MRYSAVFAAVLLFCCSGEATAAPFQSARTLDGTAFSPNSEVTVVHYWASWCAPCRIEMPVLDAYYRKHHAHGLAMLAISIDDSASAGKLKQMTSSFAFPVAQIDDVRMPRRDIPPAIPDTRVYDRSGRLVFETKADGKATLSNATLERVVDPLLAR